MPKSCVLYSKQEVMTRTQTKSSQWRQRREDGIIPRPAGREGNADRWSSDIINAIGEKLIELGAEYNRNHTIDILLVDAQNSIE